jgi:hypothetical protein
MGLAHMISIRKKIENKVSNSTDSTVLEDYLDIDIQSEKELDNLYCDNDYIIDLLGEIDLHLNS